MGKMAVDIGGSWIRYELPEQHISSKEPTPKGGLSAWFEHFLQHHRIEQMAVSFAGQIDGKKIVQAPNITIDNPSLFEELEHRFGVQIVVENDLYCAALAEAEDWQEGDLVALYSGTGLGAGVVSGGVAMRGCSANAAEIGHVPYRQAPFVCGCGKSNCLELYASGSGLRKWQEHTHTLATYDLDMLREQSPAGREIFERYVDAMRHALALVITLFNPAKVVLGGGVIAHHPWVVEPIQEGLSDEAFAPALRHVEIVRSRLSEPSLAGAKWLLHHGDA